MRICYWIILLCLGAVVRSAAQLDHTAESPYRALVEGAWVWTLGGAAKVYAGPDTQAVLYTSLKAGQPLFLLERLDETEKRRGFRTNWYRVRYAASSAEELNEGFVWGGALALQRLRACSSNLQIAYGLQSIKRVQRGAYEEPQLELVVVASRKGEVLGQTTVRAVGSIYTHTQAQLRGNQGLAGIDQIVEIAFNDGYCGGVAATVTLLWDGQKWHQLELLSQGFGDNTFSKAAYSYPQEHQKGSTLIQLRREAGYYNQQGAIIYTQQKKQWYQWTGTQLLGIEGENQ
jgi:hypothetical protein